MKITSIAYKLTPPGTRGRRASRRLSNAAVVTASSRAQNEEHQSRFLSGKKFVEYHQNKMMINLA